MVDVCIWNYNYNFNTKNKAILCIGLILRQTGIYFYFNAACHNTFSYAYKGHIFYTIGFLLHLSVILIFGVFIHSHEYVEILNILSVFSLIVKFFTSYILLHFSIQLGYDNIRDEQCIRLGQPINSAFPQNQNSDNHPPGAQVNNSEIKIEQVSPQKYQQQNYQVPQNVPIQNQQFYQIAYPYSYYHQNNIGIPVYSNQHNIASNRLIY